MELKQNLHPRVCVDSLKIFHNEYLASFRPIVPLIGNPQCHICHLLLRDENATTLFDEAASKLICLLNADNLRAASVHVFHSWCLQYFLAEREEGAPLLCPVCPVATIPSALDMNQPQLNLIGTFS
jgi:hypothetical protein